jgi:DNA-binding CsgD family transcriptional regulator
LTLVWSGTGYCIVIAREKIFAASLDHLRAALGEAVFAEAWAEGARMSLDAAVAYVRRSRGTRRRPTVGWGSLTPTELDVVRLVVAGLSNPEIGGRLFMSRGTVKTHLSHVFAKLDVANRTELATLASAHLSPPGARPSPST